MGKNAIVGQSGGPTSVINASLAGVFESCKSRGADIVYGMCNGVAGLLEERVVDLSTLLTDDLDIELLKRTPSSFLGSCRYKLPDWRTAEGEAVYVELLESLDMTTVSAADLGIASSAEYSWDNVDTSDLIPWPAA